MAEVMKYEDFKNEGSEAAVKVRIVRVPSRLTFHMCVLLFLSCFFL